MLFRSDVAGNTVTNSFTYTLDTVAPSAPTVALSSDTGLSGTDKITSNGLVNITGLETGDKWQYSINGSTYDAGTTLSGGATTGTLAASLFSQGSNTISILETDVAGNTVTNSFTYTLDTVAPTIAIDGTLMGDNRINSTEVSSVIASGTVGAVASDVGDTVTVTYSDGTHSASTTATISSSYTWQTSGVNLRVSTISFSASKTGSRPGVARAP